MSRTTKIMILAVGYAVIGFVLVKIFESQLFFDDNIWMEALAVSGIAFVVGLVENATGLGFFKKWINAE